VARPEDTGDVVSLVQWAATEQVPLVPRGAGTGMPGGNVGRGVVVDLSRWSAVGPVDRDTGVAEVGPGATGDALQKAAASAGYFFPSLPSSADRCTVGGMVANNAAGARSFGHGAVRDSVLALEAVLADGSVVYLEHDGQVPVALRDLRTSLVRSLGASPRGWPIVRKNASGYGLDRYLPTGDPLPLLVGSEGTLGIVTRVRLRFAPEPSERALVLLPLPDLEALPHATTAARATHAAACEFFGGRFLDIAGLRQLPETADLVGAAPALLMVELAGGPGRVAEGIADLEHLASQLGVPVRVARRADERANLWALRRAASPVIAARASDGFVSMQFIEDSVVPDGRLPDYLRGLQCILDEEETDAVVFGHAGDANVHVNPLVDVRRRDWRERTRRILEATVDLVSGLEGTLSGEHGDGRIRAPFQERIWGPSLAEAFRTVKGTLDPDGILNPGVVVPLEGQDPLEGLTPDRRGA